MALAKNDFIEIEFVGKTQDGKVFDSNTTAGLKQIDGADVKNASPFIFSIGHDMFLKGIDEFLIGKEVGKEHIINLKTEDAFGARDPKKIQLMPIRVFNDQKVRPVPGAMFNFDGNIAKILSVNGGRVMVDFNNPLSGKDVIYEVKVIRKIDDIKEKAAAFNEFLFRKKMNFEIENDKIILKVEEMLLQFAPMFKEKYKEVLGLDLEVIKNESLKEKSSDIKNKPQSQ